MGPNPVKDFAVFGFTSIGFKHDLKMSEASLSAAEAENGFAKSEVGMNLSTRRSRHEGGSFSRIREMFS